MAPIGYGIWGRPTATMDWCEENYIVTPLIAEFCKLFSLLWGVVCYSSSQLRPVTCDFEIFAFFREYNKQLDNDNSANHCWMGFLEKPTRIENYFVIFIDWV